MRAWSDWTTPIERHLPGEVPDGDAITVRRLLNHTSGLAHYLDDPRFAYRDEASVRRYVTEGRWIDYRPQQLLDIAESRPPYFEPGRGWHYSNTNYVLLGLLIERTTGRTRGQTPTGEAGQADRPQGAGRPGRGEVRGRGGTGARSRPLDVFGPPGCAGRRGRPVRWGAAAPPGRPSARSPPNSGAPSARRLERSHSSHHG